MIEQIKEDYVSFEIAKLLKEKEFKEIVQSLWVGKDEYHYISTESIKPDDYNSGGTCLYSAPTHQMALKWLREVHDLHIVVYPWQADNEEKAIHWCCTVYKSFAHLGNDVYTNETPKSYEQAVEAALKYTLENLI